MSVKKRQILHMIDSGRHGGAEEVLVSLIKALGEADYYHHVVLPEKGWLMDQLSPLPGVQVHIVEGRGRFNFTYLLKLIAVIKQHEIDLVHAHLFGTSFYASMAGRVCRVPVVGTLHGFIDIPGFALKSFLKLNLFGLFVNRVVTVSDGLKSVVANRMPRWRKKIITIHNGVDVEDVSMLDRVNARKQFGFSNDDVLIGAVGNIKPAKGYDLLLRAFVEIYEVHPDCRVYIIGDTGSTEFAKLKRLRSELGLDLVVKFLGYRQDVSSFLKTLDLFVLPSKSEGFSLVILDAMKASVPVIATRSGGPQEIITDRVDGLLVEVDNTEEFAHAIGEMLMNPELSQLLTEAAVGTVRERFSVEDMAGQYGQLYNCLVGGDLAREAYGQTG